MLTTFSTDSVDRLRAGASHDSDGDPADDWTNTTRLRLSGVSFQRHSSASGDHASAARLTDAATLYVDGAPDITAADRIEVDANTGAAQLWAVDGTPTVLRSLATGSLTVARLIRHEGRDPRQ